MSSTSFSHSSLRVGALSCYSCKKFVQHSPLKVHDDGLIRSVPPDEKSNASDRRVSICTHCSKAGRSCEYPRQQTKPGPKPGYKAPHVRRQVSQYNATQASLPPATGSSSILRGPAPDSAEFPALPPRAASFLELTFPTEDCDTQRDPTCGFSEPSAHDDGPFRSACQGLNLSFEVGKTLLALYFSNMTAFSLYSRDMLEAKLVSMKHAADREALLAAMFAFSSRFVVQPTDERSCPTAAQFAVLASLRLHQALEEHGDRRPPLCIVQAYALLSFYELSRSVRPRSWRILGECIRIAYEIRLHAVDESPPPDASDAISNQTIEQWAAREESRRTWWAIWEMDVFASTLRRLPTAIDWTQNATYLPVSDKNWFEKSYQMSCFLAPEPNLRWKNLAESGNRCAKAWFILVNSIMSNTQVLVYAFDTNKQLYAGDRSVDLTLIANVLSCTSMSIPDEVVYNGELLKFRKQENATGDSLPQQIDADKYSLHLMIQLSHFMINHHLIRSQAPWLNEPDTDTPPSCEHDGSPPQTSRAIWTNYLSAAEEIVAIVRNSSPNHHKYVNPFLVNTIWFAATAQCSVRVFGPSSLTRQHRLAGSNLDVLNLTIDRFMTFWESTEMLKAKLARTERGLVDLMRPSPRLNDSERQDCVDANMNFDNRDAAATIDANGTDVPNADWTSMFGTGNEIYDDVLFNGMGGGFPFGLDDLIIPGNG